MLARSALDRAGIPGEREGGERGRHGSRREAIDADPDVAQLRSNRAREPDDSVFRSGVSVRPEAALDTGGARDVQDRPASRRHHHPGRMLGAEEDPGEQHRDGVLPLAEGRSGDRTDRPENACVVHHGVQGAKSLAREVDCAGDVVFPCHVDVAKDRRRAELPGDRLALPILDVRKHAARPGGDEAPGESLANAARCARDDHGLARQLCRTPGSHCPTSSRDTWRVPSSL